MKQPDGNEPGLSSCLEVESAAGGFRVVNESGEAVGGLFETNAAAWAYADKLVGDVVPKRKKRRAKLDPRRKPKMSAKAKRRMKRNAAKAPGWLRAGAAATFDPAGVRAYRDWNLGTLGPASPVRRIDVSEYLAEKENCR